MRLPDFIKNILAMRFTKPQKDFFHRWPYVARTAAGIPMSPDRAFENDVFWAAHRYLTQTVAQLPVRVMQEQKRGAAIRVSRHPVADLFNWRANPELSPFQLKETLTGWAITHGNGVAEIEYDLAGRAVALWPIYPDRVSFCRSPVPLVDDRGSDIGIDELYYEISNGGSPKTILAARNVFHIRGFGNGPVGMNVVAYAAQSLGWAKATELFGASFFGESLSPALAVEVPGNVSREAKENIRAEMAAARSKGRDGRWLAVFDGGMQLKTFSTTPTDAQFIEAMQFQVEQVCRWIGVPPQKVHHLLRMTFNNVEQLSIEVVVDSITPWAIRWEEEANYKLFGQNRLGFFIKFDLKGLLRGAFKDRQEGLQVMRRNGIINAEEWRDLEEMGPADGEGGDTYIVEQNMVRLDQVGDQLKIKQTKANSKSSPEPVNEDGNAAIALLVAAKTLGMRESIDV